MASPAVQHATRPAPVIADTTTDREAALVEYYEFAYEIDSLSMQQALRACEMEGIAPRDPSLLGLRAALLLHHCGPPPPVDEDGAKSRGKERKELARKASADRKTGGGGTGLIRLDSPPGKAAVAAIPVWCWRGMAAILGEPEVGDGDLRERIAVMPWHEAKIACSRLEIKVDTMALFEARVRLESCLLAGGEDSPDSAARLTASDYKIIIKHLDEEQAKQAARNLEIVPMEWTEKLCKTALRSHLCPPPMLNELADENGRRGVGALMKAIGSGMKSGAAAVKDSGKTPFEKWRSFKKAKVETLDHGVARMMFEEIDTDGSGELTASELREVAEKLGGGLSEEEIDDAMMEMDHSGDGAIGVAEFQEWWTSARASDTTWTRLINKREREEQEREWLQELFDQIDADGGGTLDKDEVGELIGDLGLALNHIELDEAFQELDEDGGGDVDFDEFWAWFQAAPKTGSGLAAEMQRGLKRSEMLKNARDAMFAAFDGGTESQRHLRQLFDRLDEDGGRGIDADELTDLVNGLRLNMSRAEIEEAVDQIDATQSGEIEFHEFYQWWISDSRGAAGRLRSKLKLSAFLAKKAGSLLVAVELSDDSAGLQASEKYMADMLAQSFSRNQVMQGNSLGYFSPENPLRKLCSSILNYRHTESALIVLIVINMITMAFPATTPGVKIMTAAINLAIGVTFTIETAMRIVQLGLARGVTFDDGTTANTSFLTSWWNAFDFGIISLWWFVLLSAAIFGWDVTVVNAVSVFRSVRCLRFFPHVRQILSSIRQSTTMIMDVSYIFVMLFVMCKSKQLPLL
jgi:Ca2+-binding EF-hand superfamily protein